MAKDRYVPISMLVDIAEHCTEPHIFALTGPKDWPSELSRKVFHETVHYWQYISQRFLIRIVEEDWRRLRQFEATQEIVPTGPLKMTWLAEDAVAGFSPRDLMEAHARYCDVHAIGPPRLIEAEFKNPDKKTDPSLRDEYENLKAAGNIWRERTPDGEGRGYSGLSFDIAMRLAGGSYAAPYLRLREATNTYTAGVVFPLAAHFAMQSDEPVETYTHLVDHLKLLPEPAEPPAVESEWRRAYPLVLKLAQEAAVARTGSTFETSRHLIDRCELVSHPGYHLAAAMMAGAAKHLKERRPEWLLFEGSNAPDGDRADWTLDFLLSCPANGLTRQLDMLCYLAPPWVRFGEEFDWVPGIEFDRLIPRMRVRPDTDRITSIRREYPAGLARINNAYICFLREWLQGGGRA